MQLQLSKKQSTGMMGGGKLTLFAKVNPTSEEENTIKKFKMQKEIVWQKSPSDSIAPSFLGVNVEKNKNLYAEVKEITGGLVTKLIQIDDLERERTVQTAWLSEAEYKYGEGMVRVNVSPTLRGYLIGLKEQFTTYSLRIAVSLKSGYAIRIYELLMQYKTIGTRVITIEDLRIYLGLKPEQYSKYSMFKKRTIGISQKEINSKSDIEFDFEEIKEGRKVVAIRFNIRRNTNYGEVVKLPMGDEKGVDLVKRLKSHGVSDQKAWQIVHAYIETDVARVSWHIDELERRIKSGKPTKSLAGWLVKAIDTDHRPQKTLFQKNTEQAEREATTRRRERQYKEDRISHLESQITRQAKQYRRYVGAQIDKWRETLSEAEMEAVGRKIEAGIEKAYAKSEFKRKSWGSVLNQGHVIEYFKTSQTPLPYQDEDDYFVSEKLPLRSDLEAKLKKLQTS